MGPRRRKEAGNECDLYGDRGRSEMANQKCKSTSCESVKLSQLSVEGKVSKLWKLLAGGENDKVSMIGFQASRATSTDELSDGAMMLEMVSLTQPVALLV